MWACLPFCKHWKTGSCLGKVWRLKELWGFWSGYCETHNTRVTGPVKTVSTCTFGEILMGKAEWSWGRQDSLTFFVGGTTECEWNCHSSSFRLSLKNLQVIPPCFQHHKTSDNSDRAYLSSLGPRGKVYEDKLQLIYDEHGTWEELSCSCQIQRFVYELLLQNNLRWLIGFPLKIAWTI